jgi:hypothetical protein
MKRNNFTEEDGYRKMVSWARDNYDKNNIITGTVLAPNHTLDNTKVVCSKMSLRVKSKNIRGAV